eukprot:scaffold7530_cov74-Phaeocystis_antarctica.AAC.5
MTLAQRGPLQLRKPAGRAESGIAHGKCYMPSCFVRGRSVRRAIRQLDKGADRRRDADGMRLDEMPAIGI